MNDWLQRNFKTLALALLWLLSLGGTALLVRRPTPAAIEIIPPPTATFTPLPTPTSTPAPLRVFVSGAVLHPDVYTLAPDAIVKDAVTAAGGFDASADRESLNLAQPLYDGAQVHVPSQAVQAAAPPGGVSAPVATPTSAPTAFSNPSTSPTAAPAAPGRKVNLNTASQAELETLPGIGPALAQRIIEGRPYRTVEDLKNVKGIGEATYSKLAPLVTVQ